jgi:uncharacterized membrane protein
MTATDRYEELDAARGIAILMMILYHTIFDLYFFHLYPVVITSGFWRYFSFATASLFLLIAGISLSISSNRLLVSGTGIGRIPFAGKFIKRGAFIFGCGLIVTMATWFYLGEGFVVFGILHLIGTAIMISPLFFRYGKNNIVIGMVVTAIGIAISYKDMTGPIWLLPFGIPPALFYSVDYTPIFPWLGVVLIGLGLGNLIYPAGNRAFPVPDLPAFFRIPLSTLGKHSLGIYLVHQPVILLILHFTAGLPLF